MRGRPVLRLPGSLGLLVQPDQSLPTIHFAQPSSSVLVVGSFVHNGLEVAPGLVPFLNPEGVQTFDVELL